MSIFMSCKICGGKTEGYKCDMCGAEAKAHDPHHRCGEEHCMLKCVMCGSAEAQCTCHTAKE